MVDLCVGPHIPHTGKIKAFMVTKNSASYFLGDANNDSLQRIYGISFPDKKQLADYKVFLAEAAKRDHRKIGKDQELFFFNDLSPGSCFFLPHGTRIYNSLVELMRVSLQNLSSTQKLTFCRRVNTSSVDTKKVSLSCSNFRTPSSQYNAVISPNMYNSKLWETSGHWQNYKDDMFLLDVEKEKWALKPMNCPGHCLIFDSRDRSYKELPIRMAEFGIIHRNEASGALTGLTRVRRFVQDDTHVFCMPSQVSLDCLVETLDLRLSYSSKKRSACFSISCSTSMVSLASSSAWNCPHVQTTTSAPSRPGIKLKRYVPLNLTPHFWLISRQQLKLALEKHYPGKWDLNPGDGAFYGPKIDITIRDALRRSFQCATIQLDFQLPERFNLKYRSAEEAHNRPVIIHRAILGSLERFIAIITEHFAGKWYVAFILVSAT